MRYLLISLYLLFHFLSNSSFAGISPADSKMTHTRKLTQSNRFILPSTINVARQAIETIHLGHLGERVLPLTVPTNTREVSTPLNSTMHEDIEENETSARHGAWRGFRHLVLRHRQVISWNYDGFFIFIFFVFCFYVFIARNVAEIQIFKKAGTLKYIW